MNINNSSFEFRKTKKGKKIHICPKKFDVALCLQKTALKAEHSADEKDVCKICAREYPKAVKSACFRIFVLFGDAGNLLW